MTITTPLRIVSGFIALPLVAFGFYLEIKTKYECPKFLIQVIGGLTKFHVGEDI